mmetsp:Transcript_35901/g.44554  ORF Transcript_35901/g.44554 Transcript_35901/m.44554 type:complete len:81 (+) Transcript_35901:59-301(+)
MHHVCILAVTFAKGAHSGYQTWIGSNHNSSAMISYLKHYNGNDVDLNKKKISLGKITVSVVLQVYVCFSYDMMIYVCTLQ